MRCERTKFGSHTSEELAYMSVFCIRKMFDRLIQ